MPISHNPRYYREYLISYRTPSSLNVRVLDLEDVDVYGV